MLPMFSYDESSDQQVQIKQYTELPLPESLDPLLNLPARQLIRRYVEIQRELSASLTSDDVDMDSRPSYSNHLAEDASDAQEWQSQAALSQHRVVELRQIEHAFARLQSGEYGICEMCGHAIPLRRLAVVPATTMCVTCQERADTRH